MAPAAGDVLRSLSAIWVDAGTRDEWCLDLGAEAYVQELRAVGVSEDVLHHETYDQTHAVPTAQYVKALRYVPLTRQFWWPPPGRSHGRHRADLVATTGQIS